MFDHVGRGGMADIYLAREVRDGESRLVVLKEVLASLAQNEKLREMLISEALLAQQLDHRCIARVEQLGSHDGVPFIAMEYVEGLDLNQLLRACSRRALPVPLAARLHAVMSVLQALHHAHTAVDRKGRVLGVVHRDVSPSNVLLSFGGEVKLCDFGIALAARAAEESTAVVGKAGYMSPEHARGWKVDARSDVFAAGILLWELLAGRRMYRDKSGSARLALAARGVAPELPRLSLPDERRLVGIVERALHTDPAQRYQSARDMHQALYGYVRDNDYLLDAEQLGDWLRRHFEDERIATRRDRQRALMALDMGPAVVMTPIDALGEVSPIQQTPAQQTPVRQSGTRLVTARAESEAPNQQLPEPSAEADMAAQGESSVDVMASQVESSAVLDMAAQVESSVELDMAAEEESSVELDGAVALELDEMASSCPPIVIAPLPVPSFEVIEPEERSASDTPIEDERLADLRRTASRRRADLRRTASRRRADLRRTASRRRVELEQPSSLRSLGRFAARTCMIGLALFMLLVCLGVI